jgi:hypothetical protein
LAARSFGGEGSLRALSLARLVQEGLHVHERAAVLRA